MVSERTPSVRSHRGSEPASGEPGSGPLSLRVRVLLGYLLLLMVFGGVLFAAVSEMRKTQTSLALLSAGYLPLARDIGGAEATPLGIQLEEGQEPSVLFKARRTEQRFLAMKTRQLRQARGVARAMVEAEINTPDSQVTSAMVATLDGLLADLQSYGEAHDAFVAAMEAGDSPGEFIANLLTLKGRIEGSLHQLDSRVNRRIARVVARTNRSQGDARLAIMALSGVALGVGLLVVISTSFVLRPIRQLIVGVERIRAGHFDERVPGGARDDVGRLARSFNAMAASVQERERKLEERSAELEAALLGLRKSQTALIRSERLATIGQMAAQIAHEVRNPLNALGLNADMLVEEVESGSDEEAGRTISAIKNEVERLTRITESYLALGRLPPMELEPYPIGTLVEELVRFQGEELQQSGVEVVLALPDDFPEAMIDAAQIRQALLNIVRNAAEALAETGGGQLWISGVDEGDELRLDLKDEGPGMEAEAVGRIFDPFFSTKDSGSGLGLPITHQVIAEHGGRIECRSKVGEGTTFSIWVPRAPAGTEGRS